MTTPMIIDVFPRKPAGRESTIDSNFQRTFKVVYGVVTNDPLIGPQAAREALGIPKIGDPYVGAYEFDTSAYCLSKRATEADEDGCGWNVEVLYGPWDQLRTFENPLDVPYEVDIDFAQFEEIADQTEEDDGTHKPVLNSAGDPFDPPVMRDQSRPVINIVRNEPDPFDLELAEDYMDSTNLDVFLGMFPADTVKVASIKPRRMYSQFLNGFYWRVSYTFHVNRKGWTRKVLDAGFRSKDGTGRHPILIDGMSAASPVLLDGSGAVLATSGTPVFTPFKVFKSRDFSAFNFD